MSVRVTATTKTQSGLDDMTRETLWGGGVAESRMAKRLAVHCRVFLGLHALTASACRCTGR